MTNRSWPRQSGYGQSDPKTLHRDTQTSSRCQAIGSLEGATIPLQLIEKQIASSWSYTIELASHVIRGGLHQKKTPPSVRQDPQPHKSMRPNNGAIPFSQFGPRLGLYRLTLKATPQCGHSLRPAFKVETANGPLHFGHGTARSATLVAADSCCCSGTSLSAASRAGIC